VRFRVLIFIMFYFYQSMISLKPEPVSAIFLPVNPEQNTTLPLRLLIVDELVIFDTCVFIVLKIKSSFSFKYLAKVNKVSRIANYFTIIF